MKPYHPSAHIVIPQTMLVSGYIIHGEDKKEPAVVVDSQQFSLLVGQGHIQTLELADEPQYGDSLRQYDHRIVVSPTKEERKAFRKAKKVLDMKFDRYLESDFTFNQEDIELSKVYPGYFAVSLNMTGLMLGQAIVTIAVYSGREITDQELGLIKSMVGTTPARLASNLVLVVGPLKDVVAALMSLGCGFGINTMSNDSPNNAAYLVKMPVGLKVDFNVALQASQIMKTYAGIRSI